VARRDTWTIEAADYETEDGFRAAVVDELARFEHIGFRQGFGIVAAPVRERLDTGGIVTHAWEFTAHRIPLLNRASAPEPEDDRRGAGAGEEPEAEEDDQGSPEDQGEPVDPRTTRTSPSPRPWAATRTRTRASVKELVGDDAVLLERIKDCFTAADEGLHRHHRTVWDRMDKLYHGYRQLKDSLRGVDGDPSRYPILRDAKAEFGHELHIPYAFSTVETVLPRLLSNRPRMLVLPRTEQSEKNVENMRSLIDDQQNRINYELRVQEAAKSGLIYGLGIQKTYWKSKKTTRTEVVPSNYILRALGQAVGGQRDRGDHLQRPGRRGRRHPRLLLGPVRDEHRRRRLAHPPRVAVHRLRARQDPERRVGLRGPDPRGP
jgi:hypothetical protein